MIVARATWSGRVADERGTAQGALAGSVARWDASHAVGGGAGRLRMIMGMGAYQAGRRWSPWDVERAHSLTGQTGRRLSPAEPRADIIDRDVRWSGLVEGEEDARERER
jgi:hypothetical protein